MPNQLTFKKITVPLQPQSKTTLASAAIAQSVEHFIRNEKVAGSSPARGSASRKVHFANLVGWIFYFLIQTLSNSLYLITVFLQFPTFSDCGHYATVVILHRENQESY